MLQNVCLLPNMQLLIEGGLMSQEVEVYQLSMKAGALMEPSHVISVEARGLSAIDYTEEKIFMGFAGSMTDIRGVIQIYNFDFELLSKIHIGD